MIKYTITFTNPNPEESLTRSVQNALAGCGNFLINKDVAVRTVTTRGLPIHDILELYFYGLRPRLSDGKHLTITSDEGDSFTYQKEE